MPNCYECVFGTNCGGKRDDGRCPGTHFYKATKSHQAAPEAGSAVEPCYAPPVQAIKDAMWWVDEALQNADLDNIQRERTNKCLRELHQYLDRIGA